MHRGRVNFIKASTGFRFFFLLAGILAEIDAFVVALPDPAYYHQQKIYKEPLIRRPYINREEIEEKSMQIERFENTRHEVTDCMFVTSEPGFFTFNSTSDDESVCGLFFMAEPDRVVEIIFTHFDVPCEGNGLASFVDGWELNGEFFPSPGDHQLPLEQRLSEFCGPRVNKIFTSSQNAALIQYRIPIKGKGFTVFVKHRLNPAPCNVLANETKAPFMLHNYRRRSNCTLTALYPCAVRLIAFNVGKKNLFTDTSIMQKCESNDKIQIGGSNSLDTNNLKPLHTVCGRNLKPSGEILVGYEVTSVRLISSGRYDNFVKVMIRKAEENDILDVNLPYGL
ncbi:corticotropin-releasing factor-binding protein [Leptopilina heterotoma]|uniref:corticotropin-releasing factor-binding protein n=1 Tax=Leptopilina heterotoma TaxID=63436 RepID=UPI001CAA2A13|nr:corticotropin-releasing factor-binding protein [Leptopilina heterotoma]XP_043471552.1 corticotropin-releasing factor-binding protein [Leptopilina heterotoma]XP_043471553.1 corticotropin-releasing factor-binding protein [Leptopilina heterotoma]XP_043471554.1 corticotropin-releasing factor-binding protein [Leptopilina heterotoma]